MFPVRSLDGAIAGFGGRVLGDGEPKDLNAPDSEAFRKRERLYGLYESRAAIESRRRAIVVEGYFDVITSTQAGIDGAVSSLGTAYTRPQLEQLFLESFSASSPES